MSVPGDAADGVPEPAAPPEPDQPASVSQHVTDSQYVAMAAAGATAVVNIYGTPPDLDPDLRLRDDVAFALAQLERRNVLGAPIENELWRYAFDSLRELRTALSDTGAKLRTRGPKDVKSVLRFMVAAISAYLDRHEAGYQRYMSSHGGWEPGWAHVERDWLLHAGPGPAEDLILLRGVLNEAMQRLATYADSGTSPEWPDIGMADYWARWLADRSAPETPAGDG